MNADDLYERDAIRTIVEAFATSPDAAAIYGRARWINEADEDLGPYPVIAPFDWSALMEGCFICQPAAFIRRDALLEVGLLDERYQHAMDYEFWIRLGRCHEIRFCDTDLARSRMYAGTKTLGARRQMFVETFRILKQHYGCVPLHWCYDYAEHLIHRTDQFFDPPFMDGRVKVVGRLLFLRHNLARPDYVFATLRRRRSKVHAGRL